MSDEVIFYYRPEHPHDYFVDYNNLSKLSHHPFVHHLVLGKTYSMKQIQYIISALIRCDVTVLFRDVTQSESETIEYLPF